METIIAYAATFFLAYRLTYIVNVLPTMLLTGIVGLKFAQIIGFLIIWAIISALWQRFTHQMIPVLVLAGAVMLNFWHVMVEGHNISEVRKSTLFAEVTAIIVVGIWRIVEAPSIRWL